MTIRKITRPGTPEAVVSTIAGRPAAETFAQLFDGIKPQPDGLPAAEALFFGPMGLALDGEGRLLVGEIGTARIDALVSQLRMMTDGLAHDLKSPVTRLLSVVEQASTQTRDDQALDALEKVHREAQTLQGMLSTALLISRTEAGFGSDRMRDTPIAELLKDLAEVYGPLIEDSGFTLHVAAPAGLAFPLHRELVSQAIANLVENALKYAEGGDSIALEAAMDSDALSISVSDNGPGIPADQHEAAMKRFGRLDPSRTKPGSGLGLSLVEAVARLHHGALLLGDAAPGLRATLRLRRPA
jgi:signal transduction histidine kinase